MPEQDKNNPPGDQDDYSFYDEATKNRIKRHIEDHKDMITEDDIANVKVPGKDDDGKPPEEEIEKKQDIKSEIVPDKPITPWDTLSP